MEVPLPTLKHLNGAPEAGSPLKQFAGDPSAAPQQPPASPVASDGLSSLFRRQQR